MQLRKEGLPEEGDLVLCTVTKIYFNSVFVRIDEYDKTGMIHISEISPGRIRNINDFVTMDKKIVCKVIEIDHKKGHINLSLRRVNEIQKRNKLDEIKQEQKAEKIIEYVAKELGIPMNDAYTKIVSGISKKYTELHTFFQDLVNGHTSFDKFEIDTKLAEALEKVVRERIKPPKVEIKGELTLKSYAPDGVEIVRSALEKALKKDPEHVSIKYLGGGRYSLNVTSSDYKTAEKLVESITNVVTLHMEKTKGTAEFKRLN
ncbi:MAG: translation initiation factor IF-2 subunit alpha [Candidatus Woesearchaeota archaeon]